MCLNFFMFNTEFAEFEDVCSLFMITKQDYVLLHLL